MWNSKQKQTTTTQKYRLICISICLKFSLFDFLFVWCSRRVRFCLMLEVNAEACAFLAYVRGNISIRIRQAFSTASFLLFFPIFSFDLEWKRSFSYRRMKYCFCKWPQHNTRSFHMMFKCYVYTGTGLTAITTSEHVQPLCSVVFILFMHKMLIKRSSLSMLNYISIPMTFSMYSTQCVFGVCVHSRTFSSPVNRFFGSFPRKSNKMNLFISSFAYLGSTHLLLT